MRYILASVLVVAISALGAVLPTCYYTYDQITQMLADYQDQHPDIAKRVLLGYSQQDLVPIYAMRISDNVDVDEEEPALLFVGQVHAEEVLGVQITMSNIQEILANRYQQPYSQWINQLDLWFVPTLNPEGHNVVTANLDTSYRKNKRDMNNNGVFDYSPLVGYDLDGVDINRNFSFNWVHGDTLWQPGGLEVWDYYRGPAEISESETQAIEALCDQYKFVYSICWHSSRTGNFSEKAYYSFNWKEVRPSPDLGFAQTITAGIAGQIIKEAGGATYEVLPNLSRKGCFHDWMYQQYGSFQTLVECGTRNLQPDSLLMVDTVNRCSNGVRWLLNRALPYSTAVPSSSMLTGNIRDAVTNEPLEARIIIEQHHAPWFRPRTSKPDTGRYFKALPTGNYTVRLQKRGYEDLVVPNVVVNNASWTIRNFQMQPLPQAQLSINVRCGEMYLPAQVILYELDPVTLAAPVQYQTYPGTYAIEISHPGFHPFVGTITLQEGANHRVYDLSPEETLFYEGWETGTSNWEINGPWVRQNELSASGYAITDSWGGWGFYEMNCDVWIKTLDPISLPAGSQPLLIFDSHLYTEWEFDPVTVEGSTDGNAWTAIWTKSGRHDQWKTEYVSLADYTGQSVFLRFRLQDESTHVELTDPGWTLDNIRVVTGTVTASGDELNPALPINALYPNFPNPFNPETTIVFNLAATAPLKLEIYNLKGQKVRTLINDTLPAGNHRTIWNGKDDANRACASGIYYIRLHSGRDNFLQKAVLVK